MKKISLVILPLVLIISCSKNPNKIIQNKDSADYTINKADTLHHEKIREEEHMVTDSLITRVIDMSKLPVEVREEFTNENQKLVLRLKNTEMVKISGQIIPDSGSQNIRFNNIELNNQSIDGPFGRDFNYDLSQKGDYSIVIGKSLMAEGSQKGKFKVQLK
ncbi:hypothetical protein BAX94_15045 [Elizabethkingia meningoseptica]|uniref:Lipoprotein n=1 Tax=Elizabethkingia meningoseptica TaxID=238 RepID=A0A1V3U326_ELIME|nr:MULTISPECIES: hypothetical protein [Elizabethkingia]AQX12318.1 hypothetical protein BBD35_07990 [Elizabethkingia meningoseptica]MBG0513845.1 hypothetical protein [Elizabethkingia meningoseptica]MCL1676565.1 hypothetical protein [Elizabethkingia meningoseptica]MCL1687371.1 hypothetical protein [Elizabethkingia meningoseptica]MDE5432489.1 hypothetical protein [Elizabethkingia meningoseptica]